MSLKLQPYQAQDGFRWKLLSSNGNIIADCAEAYSTKQSMNKAIKSLADRFKKDAAKVLPFIKPDPK